MQFFYSSAVETEAHEARAGSLVPIFLKKYNNEFGRGADTVPELAEGAVPELAEGRP